MRRTETVIVGAGQAGLALSRCLTERSVAHVLLERGRIGERWRSERWDSLRLLTPSWQSRLPGWVYDGADPDGYMTRQDVVEYLERYARSFAAPVETGTTVLLVRPDRDRWLVRTDRGDWSAGSVVIATGHSATPAVPELAAELPTDLAQVVPSDYRNPAQLATAGVLVVGASATGVQLAEEIHASGRPVTLSVGRHTRLPRTYRGWDIMWWLDVTGILDERVEEIADPEAARRQPSLQLVGRPQRASLDLNVLQELGIRLAGRTVGVAGRTVRFADDLAATTRAADVKLTRLLDRIDAFISEAGLAAAMPPPDRPAPVVPPPGPAELDLDAAGIRTVLWATGFRRSYPWLDAPVFDEHGEIRHDGGVTPAAGLYVLGLNLQRRRKSTYLDGVGTDAAELAALIAVRSASPGGAAEGGHDRAAPTLP